MKMRKIRLVQLSRGRFRTVKLWPDDHGYMEAILKEPTENHITIVDGMYALKAIPLHECLLIVCRDICQIRNTCKLAIASSMEVMGEEIADNPTDYSVHKVSSWMLDDYYTAIENNGLSKAVAKKLDTSLDMWLLDKINSGHEIPLADRKVLIDAKYYYAGVIAGECSSFQPRS